MASELVRKKHLVASMEAMNALKGLRLKKLLDSIKALEGLHSVEAIAKRRKLVSFDQILRVVYKDKASRIKLEKLAKVLSKIVTRKLARIGLDEILHQGESQLKREEIVERNLGKLIFA